MGSGKQGCKVYIVGAHSRGQTLAEYLRGIYPGTEVGAFLYDNDEENPQMVGGIRALRIDGDEWLDTSCPVYIATRGVYHEKITRNLKIRGFGRICPVTPELDMELRNAYVRKYYAGRGRGFVKISEVDPAGESRLDGEKAAIYVARSASDRPLRDGYRLAPYEREIQAGAALAGAPLYPGILTDDKGDNISGMNGQYCELTALYWLWKHAGEDIVGLAHYRRHFILPGDWASRMEGGAIDVVLPVPLYVAPSLAGNFKSRHSPLEWDEMMGFLERRDKAEYGEAEAFFQGNLYSPCNMSIMRREALDDLCGWLFPLLFEVSANVGRKGDAYQNRYPGFLSERLTSFFFEKNRGKYKVAYADKNFLA